MLLNARRIVFEPEFQLPTYNFAMLYTQQREENLLNKDGQFFVNVSEKHPYVKQLVKKAQDLGLSVSGDGTAPVGRTYGDIRNVEKGNQITFGTSSRFDVNWTRRDEYFCQKGYAPVYDIVKDWNKIDKAMKQFAEQKKAIKLNDGTNIRFHARFCVVDGRVVRYEKDQVLALLPVATLKSICDQYDIINIQVIRNW